MPPKKNSIYNDVLKKAAGNAIPSKVEITVKPPYPFNLVQLKAVWEKREDRELSEEEVRQRWQVIIEKHQPKVREQNWKVPKETNTI